MIRLVPLLLLISITCSAQLKFTRSTEKSTTTQLAFVISDSGRVVLSPHKVFLRDTNHQLIDTFDYELDVNSNPIPHTLTPGVYEIDFVAKGISRSRWPYTYSRIKAVRIAADSLTVVTAHVRRSTLRFQYEDSTGKTIKRPVSKYSAMVNLRHDKTPPYYRYLINCSEEVDYPAGNYYIEVNTTPISRYNIDMTWNSLTSIQLREEGYLDITTRGPGILSFYQPNSAKDKTLVKILEMKLDSGKLDRVELMPGTFEIHWKKPGKAWEEVKTLTIKARQVSELHLN
jgi:hypothetical protein